MKLIEIRSVSSPYSSGYSAVYNISQKDIIVTCTIPCVNTTVVLSIRLWFSKTLLKDITPGESFDMLEYSLLAVKTLPTKAFNSCHYTRYILLGFVTI